MTVRVAAIAAIGYHHFERNQPMTRISRFAIGVFLFATGYLLPVSAQAGDDDDDLVVIAIIAI
jgi:hypothetical protein